MSRFCLLALLVTTSQEALAQETTVFSGSGDEVIVQNESPNYYVVQQGDTLWDISNRSLGNSYYWPRLWSINDQITNPHWIYPGNRIVFRMGTLIEPPRVELETLPTNQGYTVEGLSYESVEAQCGADVRFDTNLGALQYDAPAFLSTRQELVQYGSVYKARGIQTWLAERDLIYLSLDDPDAFDCGDVVSIFRQVDRRVRHPESRRNKFGDLYAVVATAKVVNRYGDLVTASIRDSYWEVGRGDLVGPEMPVKVEVEVNPPVGDLDATIVTRLNQHRSMASVRDAVFLDRGRADGVRVGDTFYVVEQRDENLDHSKEDLSLPPSVIGRVVVVRVDEYASAAVITDADRPINVGARLAQKLR